MPPKSEKKESKVKKQKFCLQESCGSQANVKGYCRLHYITHWKEIQSSAKDKAEKRLNAYVDRMAQRYPKDYMERIKEGLENEESFKSSMEEMETEGEQASDSENEFLEKFLRDIKGGSE